MIIFENTFALVICFIIVVYFSSYLIRIVLLKWNRTLWPLPHSTPPHHVLCLPFVCGKL